MTQIVSISDLCIDPIWAGPGESDSSGTELALFRGGAISIGNFDGVHRGHAELLGQLKEMADQFGGPAVAVTFDPHPAAILRPDSAPIPLTTMAHRADRMNALGIDALVVCRTSPALLNLTAEQFYQSLVTTRLQARGIVEGPNFFFGRDRLGDVAMLQRMASRDGIEFKVAEPTKADGEMVSSSLIRASLSAGDVRRAARLCGYRHQIRASVGRGARRGRELGFPTANLAGIDVFVPKIGVYAALASVGEVSHLAAVHIGPNPTFESDPTLKVEVHLLDYDGDLYGQAITISFVDWIRDVTKFDSADSLKRQLNSDVQEVRKRLANQ